MIVAVDSFTAFATFTHLFTVTTHVALPRLRYLVLFDCYTLDLVYVTRIVVCVTHFTRCPLIVDLFCLLR